MSEKYFFKYPDMYGRGLYHTHWRKLMTKTNIMKRLVEHAPVVS